MNKRQIVLQALKRPVLLGYQWLHDERVNKAVSVKEFDTGRESLQIAQHIINDALADEGHYCPRCGSNLVDKNAPIDYGHTMTLFCSCDSCDHTWIKEYFYFPNTLDSK